MSTVLGNHDLVGCTISVVPCGKKQTVISSDG